MASPVPNPLPPGGGEAVASAPALVTSSESGEPGAEIPPLISSTTRIPALDGLRGIAILLVLVFHLLDRLPASVGILRYLVVAGRLAWSGVDLFFVLSGFLIGGILLDAQRSPHYYKTFYLRRAFRILPIYAVLLALAGSRYLPVPVVASLGRLYPSKLPWACYFTFTQNVAMALGFGGIMSLSPTWSLAVEEQFYLTMPLVVRRLSRRRLALVLVAVVIAAPLLRSLLYHFYSHGPIACYVLMPCRADALSLGVLSAMACRERRCWNFLVARRSALGWIAAVLVVGLVLLTLEGGSPKAKLMATIGYSCLALFYTCWLLLAVSAVRGSALQRVLTTPSLTQLGVVAYFTYLFHLPITEACRRITNSHVSISSAFTSASAFAIGLAITLALAAVSWRFFEKPLIRVGRRFTY